MLRDELDGGVETLTRVDQVCSVLHMNQSPRDTAMLDRLRQARAARAEHEQAFVDQVRTAMADRNGHPVREIAEASGLSRERLYQIARGTR